MALFKIFKGNNTAKITNSSATGYITPTDGYAYYDTGSKLFYIDAAYSGTTISRQPINADNATNGIFYGTCTTAQATQAKVATLTNGTGFSLKAGTIVAIKFTYASAASTMTLNVNNTGAKNLYQYGTTLMSSGTTTTGWPAGAVIPFVYDGTYWFRLYWNNTVTTVTTTGTGNAITAISASNGAITATKGATFLTSHQDISGKADKSATVSTLTWDSTNKKITKTINGSTSDVVQFAAGGNIALTGAAGKLTIEAIDTKVTQNNTIADNDYRVLLSASANDTIETSGVNKSINLQYNPSTNLLKTGNISGSGDLTITGNANLNGETYAESITAGSLLVNGNANFVQSPTAPTPEATSNDTTIATTAFVMNAFTANDAMVFKGVVNANGDLPTTHKQGWTYRVATAGTYAGKVCEVGDMIICVTDGTVATDAHWAVIQNNVDGAVYRGTNAFTDANVIVADSTNGKVKSSGKTITATAPSSSAVDTTIPTSKAVWSAISGASGYGKIGTVTGVQVQATSPVVSSTSGNATTSLNTTISLANGYGDTKNPYAAKTANYVLAGPSSGTATAVPTFRALVAADIPSLTKSKISDFPTNVSAFTNDSGYVTSSGVTDVTFNTSDSIIYKTINGTTSSIVEIPILAGSGNNSAYGGGAIEPSKATAFAFGNSAEANGVNSIALGANSKANSMHSISLGLSSSTTGARSIAIGYAASTSGTDAIAIGSGVLANGAKQMALGCYNIADTSSTYCLIVGNGTADDARSNAMTVDYNGNLDVTGNIKANNITNDTISASSTSATIPTSDAVWAAISGASGYGKVGTVTSVRVQATAPIVSSSSAAATTSLNTTISLAATSANYVIAGPSSGTATAVPTYRKLVAADIPSLGNLSNDGKITTTATIASGDKLVIVDSDSTAGSKITGSSITFGTSTTTFLSNKGTWVTPPGTYSLPLAASGTRGGIQIGYSESGNNYAVKLSSEKAYVTVPWTDTKNTAGSTDTSSKIYLIGATSQAANPQTYSDNQIYATDGQLDANKVRVAEAVSLVYDTTLQALNFIFA